jgi:hypothetical protein
LVGCNATLLLLKIKYMKLSITASFVARKVGAKNVYYCTSQDPQFSGLVNFDTEKEADEDFVKRTGIDFEKDNYTNYYELLGQLD